MPKNRIEIGEVIELSQYSRRNFLKYLTLSGGSFVGLNQAIATATGKEPEGKPLVHTYDKYGNPDRVRVISEDRHRKITRMKNIPVGKLEREAVSGVAMREFENGPDDLGVEISIGKDHEDEEQSIREEMRDDLGNIPIEVSTVSSEHGGDRYNTPYDPLFGGPKANGSSETTAGGTLTIAGYDSDGNELLVHSDHVMEGASEMYQPAGGDRTVGELHQRSEVTSGNDVTSYHVDTSEVDIEPLTIINWENDTVVGTWDHWGLGDEIIENGPVAATLVGNGGDDAMKENEAIDVVNGGDRCTHQVFFEERNAAGGDSGGAWVDDRGRIVAVHSGWVQQWSWSDRQDVGASGQQALEAVDTHLLEQ